jgi:antitoxin MazE
MKTRIIQIGNSRGIRIPKPMLQQVGLNGEVEVIAKNGTLVIRSTKQARAGWAAAFKEMARRSDDRVLDQDSPTLTRWDEEEWEWQ